MDDGLTSVGAAPEQQTTGAPATGAGAIPLADVKAELDAQYRKELEARDAQIQELNRVKGNLVNQVANYKRLTEAGATQGSYTAPVYTPPSQTNDEAMERLQRTELQLQQMRFFDYATQNGYGDLRDPNVRAVLAGADDAVVESLTRDGYNLTDPRTEPLYFKRILEAMDANPLYKAYKQVGATKATEPATRSGEVTASSTSGAAAEVGAGITPAPQEEAAKRLQAIRNAVYPTDGVRRTGRL